MALRATALSRLGRVDEALEAARHARQGAEQLGPTPRALAMLAEARALAAAQPASAFDDLLAAARLLADAVDSSEIVAAIDKERGVQALNRGQFQLSIEPLTTACLHWLATGNTAPLVDAVDALDRSLVETGRREAARQIRTAFNTGTLTSRTLLSTLDRERGL